MELKKTNAHTASRSNSRRTGMDIVAAIDLETTGLDEARCEIIDMAIVPLNADFSVSEEIPEFTTRIKAEHPETAEEAALRVNGMNPSDGVPLDVVRRDFAAWLQDNGIRKIVPLAHNLGFDMKFLLKTFPEAAKVFSHRGRDSMRLALAINDVYQRERQELMFPSASLAAVKENLGIVGEVNHRAFEDAKDAALVYRRLINLMTLAW